jgi:S-adenosylhomocysteine hydrolase
MTHRTISLSRSSHSQNSSGDATEILHDKYPDLLAGIRGIAEETKASSCEPRQVREQGLMSCPSTATRSRGTACLDKLRIKLTPLGAAQAG